MLAVLLVLVMIAAACGSDASSSDSTASGDAEIDFASEASSSAANRVDTDDSADMEETFADAPASDEAMAEGVQGAEESGSAPATTVAPSDNAAENDSRYREGVENGRGLFDTIDPNQEPEEIPEPIESVDPRFTDYGIRTFVETSDDPLSTFALDVDTGSYTIGRRFIEEGNLPPRESVRVEEYVNAFDYDYDVPRSGLDVSVDGGPSPFDEDTYLIRIGIQAEIVEDAERQPVALTFVIDTSGSMDRADRLGLVKESLSLLVEELHRDDTVAIVTYSGDSDVVLEPTEVRDRDEILEAIDDLRTGGSTNLQAGLDAGYDLARDAFRDDGVNRVIVASDGLANAGITDVDRLSERIRRDADAGIGLVTVGYGLNGFNDTTMEQLADQGDGFYAYVDTIAEAERLFSEDLTSTLITAAIDAKIQVEFDEDVVDEYRLIGYENRGVRDNDFRNDEIDAGELGAGHQATALYEIVLDRSVDIDDRAELGVVRLRWEDPETGEVNEIDEDIDMRDIEARWTDTPADFQQATVVAAFAELLRDNPYADNVDLEDLRDEADSLGRDIDTDEFDAFADLVEEAYDLS
ncbi:MAG: Ca-activated chloride channel family protein [Verrucomicrobiales bacterium]|jgi:Ca-activated chloride channel family protein